MPKAINATKIPAPILSAAVALLRTYHPNLTEQRLESALQNADTVPSASTAIERPMTRKQVAEIMGCSLQSINRWMNAGILKKIHIGKRAVRIDAASVRVLVDAGINATPSLSVEQ